MEVYLIQHGQADERRALDPYSARLTPEGVAQAHAIAQRGRAWGVDFLCASTLHKAQETADILQEAVPGAERWDLKELEQLNLDDLEGAPPGASSRVQTWTEEQQRFGTERLWIRVMAALARIEVYATTRGLERVAIVAQQDVHSLLLLNWLGLDWRDLARLAFALEDGGVSHVTLDGGSIQIHYINCTGR